MKRMVYWQVVAIFTVSMATAGEVGYIDDFALAKDRTTSLRQLIPGTEDYYYYHCLHFLNTEQFEKVDEFARPWLQRFGQTAPIPERLPHLQALFELRRRMDEIKLFGSESARPIQGSRASRGVAS